MYKDCITDVPGIFVGQREDQVSKTGCTVILCPQGAVAGVDVRGGAPGTRETDLLKPYNLVDKVHAVLLAGGSAFGLDAAAGVMAYLEEKGYGFDTGVAKVPIVPGAVIFDLAVGDPNIRPDKLMGYQACENGSKDKIMEGSFGAGTGATVGKVLGVQGAMMGGVGSSSIELGNGIWVGAIVVTNSFGDITHPKTGEIIAGARKEKNYVNTEDIMLSTKSQTSFTPTNTTIGVVATNAFLTKSSAAKIAAIAHNGYARAIRPVHTMFDGDTIFCLSTGDKEIDLNVLGVAAVRTVERAILNGVMSAKRYKDILSYKDIVI